MGLLSGAGNNILIIKKRKVNLSIRSATFKLENMEQIWSKRNRYSRWVRETEYLLL